MAAPTAKGYFADRALCPEIMASMVILEARHNGEVTQEQANWFVAHADTWLRWMHANKPIWRKKLERQENKDRDFILTFVRHWKDAFVQNPDRYKLQHPLEDLK